MDETIARAICQGLQAVFEAVNECAKQLNERQAEAVHAKTKRIAQARMEIELLMDQRR